jgi:hypothetical protein
VADGAHNAGTRRDGCDIVARAKVPLTALRRPCVMSCAEIAVRRAVGRVEDELQAIGQREFAADDQRQPGIPGGEMRAPPATEHSSVMASAA